VVRIASDLDVDIAGRDVLLVEDIVDTGTTLAYIMNMLKLRHPASLEICALLHKPVARPAGISIRYLGREIPDVFVVGYGLDFDENYRNLPFVAGFDRPTGR
jgi:hypoxanthine phosphoribosyltransferase